MPTVIGLSTLCNNASYQALLKGNVGLLAHSASVDSHLNFAPTLLQKFLGTRLTKLFGPQHGLITDVQDNMIETQDFLHPFFKLPVHSLYGQTRIPTDEMLEGIDTIVVDLQDVGTRIYTYIYTMGLLMESCGKKDIKVVVLDRPNPLGGEIIEGNILDLKFKSFVGLYSIPVRHGMTIGEIAIWIKKNGPVDCELEIIPLKNWKRSQYFDQTGLSWVLPSPNMPTVNTALAFPATVLFEGAMISEGRGTTMPLEFLGHPKIEPFSFVQKINTQLKSINLQGQFLRPTYFRPMFQKYTDTTCGGFQIHITDRQQFSPWKLGQALMKCFHQELGPHFSWKKPPYEYEYDRPPIDFINGTDRLRHWVEQPSWQWENLLEMEKAGQENFQATRNNALLY